MSAQAATSPSPIAEFVERIPWEFAREHLILADSSSSDSAVSFLISSRTPLWVPGNVGVHLGRKVACEIREDEALATLIDKAYEQHHAKSAGLESPETSADALELQIDDADRDLLSVGAKGDVARILDRLLFEALSRGASDIHIQPVRNSCLVRYRIDGYLLSAHTFDHSASRSLISRVKVLGKLDLAEQRLPQDGRASVTIGRRSTSGRQIDLRISTLPSSHGERVVIRLLDSERDAGLQSFDALGMPPDVESRFKSAANRPNGIVLVTGPTGSGKSTTLYTTLRYLASSRPGANIMTIEDPIEFDLSEREVGISQTQVNLRKGMTFPRGLRHILRQDPDVVMIGEIRDTETARIAIQASLTGHLVFSTLHTNDAASAVTRLLDLGIERYLVSASLSCILAQRLVRRVHTPCGGKGCDECLRSGYRGRLGVFELLVVDEAIRNHIARGSSEAEVRAAAIERGMQRLDVSGKALIDAGLTDALEISRVIEGACA